MVVLKCILLHVTLKLLKNFFIQLNFVIHIYESAAAVTIIDYLDQQIQPKCFWVPNIY